MTLSVPAILKEIDAGSPHPPLLQWLRHQNARTLFPGATAPELAFAALLVAVGGWDEAHTIAQDIDTPEGAYLHGMIHRQEPDEINAAYWFRKAGPLPFTGLDAKAEWRAFFEHCRKVSA